MPPPLGYGALGLSDDARLTYDVCLSVAYIGDKSRTERSRKTKIGIEVAHVTRDSDTTFKVKRSKVKLQGREHFVAASRTACYNKIVSRIPPLPSDDSHCQHIILICALCLYFIDFFNMARYKYLID